MTREEAMDFETDIISTRYATKERIRKANKEPYRQGYFDLLSIIAINLAEIADELAEINDKEGWK